MVFIKFYFIKHADNANKASMFQRWYIVTSGFLFEMFETCFFLKLQTHVILKVLFY